MATWQDFPWFVQLLINVAIAGGIFILAIRISGIAKRLIHDLGLRYDQLDDTLFSFLGSLARYAILALSVIFILNRFGFETTSLVALVGAAGLAIGLALQGTLSNLAAGVMLLLFRPFKAGDFIEAAGQSGTVKDITLFTTELATPDNVQIIVPNGDVWSSAITNYSTYDTRRVDLVFGVSYGANLATAEQIIRTVIEADDRAQQDPEPFVKVTALNDSSVDFTVRVWCERSDYFSLKCDLTRAMKEAFDAGGVDIPFPTRTVLNQG